MTEGNQPQQQGQLQASDNKGAHSDIKSAYSDNQKNLTQLVYALQAISMLAGVTAIAGLILNYLKRDEVKGSYLESHFNWQIKTFWYALAGVILGWMLTIVLIGFLILPAVAIWYIYRIVKGWLALNDDVAMPDGLF